jgi:hypothetical protein
VPHQPGWSRWNTWVLLFHTICPFSYCLCWVSRWILTCLGTRRPLQRSLFRRDT